MLHKFQFASRFSFFAIAVLEACLQVIQAVLRISGS